jgi:hypothetical protein
VAVIPRVEFQLRVLGDVFFVRWRQRGGPACNRLLQILERTRRTAARSLRYVSLIDMEVPALPQAASLVSAQLYFRAILAHCTGISIVIEGDEPRRTLERVRAAGVLAGTRDAHRVAVYKSVPELASADPSLRRELSAAMASLTIAA